MNSVLTFLDHHRERLGLDHYGVPARLSSLVLTPRFRASRHVVFLIMPEGQPDPVLVAKVPRLAGTSASLSQEAGVLGVVQAQRSGGFDSVPRVIAFEEYHGYPILVETAIVGRAMDPATVRRDRAGCCAAVIEWLADVQQTANSTEPDWFERLAQPLRQFAGTFPLSADEEQTLEQTWALLAPLREAPPPLVLEHGDLSHPNLILRPAGGLGVVDWELAVPNGLPACDLFFFLTYVAFALHNARAKGDYLSPFHAAFFGEKAWARPYVETYAERMHLPPHLIAPLFLFCWARYMSQLLVRLDAGDTPGPVESGTAEWLRSNRYYALWRHTVRHIDELHLTQ